jgi:hypothetical protein
MNAMMVWNIYGDRARRAYSRSGGVDQPSSCSSGAEEVDGKHYIVLGNARGVLAVYRVGNDDTLRRLRRWPASIES